MRGQPQAAALPENRSFVRVGRWLKRGILSTYQDLTVLSDTHWQIHNQTQTNEQTKYENTIVYKYCSCRRGSCLPRTLRNVAGRRHLLNRL